MRLQLACTVVCLLFVVGCGKDESKKQMSSVPRPSNVGDASASMSSPSLFNQDIGKICDAEQLSGATEMAKGYNRAMTVAKWLGENLRTPEGRRFLGETARLGDPKKKAKALAAQATASGVADCPLVRTWSGGETKKKI